MTDYPDGIPRAREAVEGRPVTASGATAPDASLAFAENFSADAAGRDKSSADDASADGARTDDARTGDARTGDAKTDDASADGARTDDAGGWSGGWLGTARRCDSPNFGPRPGDTAVGLVLIHSISLPPGAYTGDAVERLFTNRLDWAAHPYFETIRGLRVSSHFFIRRDGELTQFVSCDDRAWHAGASSWCGRAGCNDYAIGIELEGLEGGCFEPAQYTALVELMQGLGRRYRLSGVAGHEHVAPGRKADPGPGFDWGRLVAALGWPTRCFPDSTA